MVDYVYKSIGINPVIVDNYIVTKEPGLQTKYQIEVLDTLMGTSLNRYDDGVLKTKDNIVPANFATDPATGRAVGLVDPVSGLIQVIAGMRTIPLRVATFGDSTANCAVPQSPDNQDSTKFASSAWQAGTILLYTNGERWALPSFYPQAYLVGNGGITGQTTTQMLARDTLAASVTRKSITDVINLGPNVVILRGGSINNFIGASPTSVATTIAEHQQIVQRLLSANIYVIDEGIFGYSSTPSAWTQAQVRQALIDCNAAYATFAALYPTRMRFINPVGITCDATGAYLAGMSYDGTHLSGFGGLTIARLEAQVCTAAFGPSLGPRYPGQNNIANAFLTNTTSPGYGTLATNFGTTATNTTRQNAKIEVLNGKPYQTCEFVINSAGAIGGFTLPFDPTATATGMVAPMAVNIGDVWGYEFDYYVAPVSGMSQVTFATTLRLDIRDSVGSGRVNIDTGFSNPFITNGEFFAHASFNPVQFGDVSANLTTASAVLCNLAVSETSGVFKLGVSQPRLVKLGQAVTTY